MILYKSKNHHRTTISQRPVLVLVNTIHNAKNLSFFDYLLEYPPSSSPYPKTN